MVTDPGVAAAVRAFARGDFRATRSALGTLPDDAAPALHELLARACHGCDDFLEAASHAERAYAARRAAGETRAAALDAAMLASIYDSIGSMAAVRGWVSRAERLLEDDQDCRERGYVALARIGCERRDAHELLAGAELALALARRFGDTNLEARALGESGLALASMGRLEEGMDRLEQAVGAVLTGDGVDHVTSGMVMCTMLHACERLDDVERADEWTQAVDAYASHRFGDPPLPLIASHCRQVHGSLLLETGRWEEAEAAFRQAIARSSSAIKRREASCRLALLELRRGRLVDAELLVAGFEDRVEAAFVFGRLHLARGEIDLADGVVRRALSVYRSDIGEEVRLHSLLVEVACARRDVETATASAAAAHERAALVGAPGLVAQALLARARAKRLRGDDGVQDLCAALAALDTADRPVLRADIELELASALADTDPSRAAAEARAALAIFDRLRIRSDSDRASALLRTLGVSTRVSGRDPGGEVGLSPRESDVLNLLAAGLSNADIAKRLFISPRTAEHHVSSILTKLDLRSRAEAAAYAASRRADAPSVPLA